MVSCTLLAHGSINNYRPTIDDVAFLIIITHGLRVIERQSAIDGHAMSASSMPRFPLFFASIICNGQFNICTETWSNFSHATMSFLCVCIAIVATKNNIFYILTSEQCHPRFTTLLM